MPMQIFDQAEVAKIDEAAFKIIKANADAGDGDALNTLACCYYHGHRVPQDKTKAFQLFQQAGAPTGLQNPDATYNLGQCHFKGIGTAKNNQLAGETFYLAKILKHSKANEMLEEKELKGNVNFFEILLDQTKYFLLKKLDGGTSPDPKNAGFERAIFVAWGENCKQFDKKYEPVIKHIMGDLASLSIGTKEVDTIPNHEHAIRCYTLGLKDNSLYCNFRLAMYYFKGKCLEKNPIKTVESALNILQKVALSSDKDFIAPLVVPPNYLRAQAYHQMGIYYLSLEGGAKDPQKANDCFNKAYQLHPIEAYKALIKPEFKIEEKAKTAERAKIERAKAEQQQNAKIGSNVTDQNRFFQGDEVTKNERTKLLQQRQQELAQEEERLKLKAQFLQSALQKAQLESAKNHVELSKTQQQQENIIRQFYPSLIS